MATAPLGTTERTNQLLAEASEKTGVAAPTFDNATGAPISTPPTPKTPVIPGSTSGAGAGPASAGKVYDTANASNGVYYTANGNGTYTYHDNLGRTIENVSEGGVPSTVRNQFKAAPSVFSAEQAQNFTNKTIVPTFTDGINAMAGQNEKNASSDLTHFLPGETPEAYNARVQAVNSSKGGTQTTTQPTAEETAATQVANTPESGNQFIYDTAGQRLEVPVGTPIPAGYTNTPPANPTQRGHTVVNQFNAENGTTYQQYSDGSYGVAGLDGTFAGSVSQDEFNKAQETSPAAVLKSITTGLASLKNGPLPLTAPQQAQIDALNANLASAVKAQQTANDNYNGAVSIAVNLSGMGNAISGMGIIKSAVDSGVAKIFDLQTKAAGTIAQMEEAFNKDNLDQMYQYYQAYTAATKAIDDQITAMHTFAFQQKEHADQEADNLRTFNQKVQQDAITNKREDALATSTLETQALDRQKTALDIKNLNLANGGLNGLPGGSVIGADGKPDPNLQNAYLQTIAKSNPGMANTIKGIAEYRVSMPASFLRSAAGLNLINMVETYDPTFDQSQYLTRYNLNNNFTSGAYSKTINSLNTATAHIDTLANQVKSLGNVGFVPANVVKNFVGSKTGILSTAGAKTSIAGVTGELAAAFKQSGATDQEIKALGTVDENSSPQDIKKYVESATSLLAGKLGALNDTYSAGMGQAPTTPLLHPDAVKALETLKNEGYTINIPGVIYTDVKAFTKNVPDAGAKLDAARQLLIDNKLPVTPDNILQAAQLENQ